MIDLTPLEVRQKKGDFRRGMRGYDVELVNDFLDLVADRMEELVKQNLDLTDRVEELEEELRDFRHKERALSEALMAAQKLQEDARSHAEKEAELVIREARLAAESAREDTDRAIEREHETLRQVRARRAQLIASFRRLLERELAELDVIEETLELQAEERRSADQPEPGAGTDDVQLVAGIEEETGAAEGAAAPSEASAGDGSAGQEPEPTDDAAEEEEEQDEQEDWLSSLMEEKDRR